LGNLLGLYSCFFKDPAVEKWRSVVEAGISEAELSVRFTRFNPAEKYLEAAGEYFEMLTEGGLHVSSIHLPFGPEMDVSSPEKGDAAVKDMEGILDWAREKKIGIAVIHSSFEPIDPLALTSTTCCWNPTGTFLPKPRRILLPPIFLITTGLMNVTGLWGTAVSTGRN
jgi:sugar phosphate isomerase/epimerase